MVRVSFLCLYENFCLSSLFINKVFSLLRRQHQINSRRSNIYCKFFSFTTSALLYRSASLFNLLNLHFSNNSSCMNLDGRIFFNAFFGCFCKKMSNLLKRLSKVLKTGMRGPGLFHWGGARLNICGWGKQSHKSTAPRGFVNFCKARQGLLFSGQGSFFSTGLDVHPWLKGTFLAPPLF